MKKIKLIAFDMDGVLTNEVSSWEYLHRAFGVSNKSNWDLYERDRISYEEFLKSDVSLWLDKFGKVSERTVREILDKIELKQNLKDTLSKIRNSGIKIIIISGGIYWLAEKINTIVSFDDIYANCILVDSNGFLKKEGFAPVDPKKKGELLEKIQGIYDIRDENTVVVGDSDHDVLMFDHAAFSIAFNPSSRHVADSANYVVLGENFSVITEVLENIQKRMKI
ncbi:MAG: HAD-IB family phosphatase [Candidatus Thermoplasmatota archaeon]|nr:HAD-IB family phosphatase [Candidatus Thermoplasmatota archaeon]